MLYVVEVDLVPFRERGTVVYLTGPDGVSEDRLKEMLKDALMPLAGALSLFSDKTPWADVEASTVLLLSRDLAKYGFAVCKHANVLVGVGVGAEDEHDRLGPNIGHLVRYDEYDEDDVYLALSRYETPP